VSDTAPQLRPLSVGHLGSPGPMTATAGDALDLEALGMVVADATGAPCVVSELVPMSGGASRETWSFKSGETGDNIDLFILQRSTLSVDATDKNFDLEAQVLTAAATAGVRVPKLLAHSATDDPLGRPFLLSAHVEGESIARKIQRDARFHHARGQFAADCGRELGLIHSIDVAQVGSIEPEDQLDRYHVVLDELGRPHPTFELAIRWLSAHRPGPGRSCLVHGDFRLGNLLIADHGVTAVLDWELAHLGDPMEDLGWLCTKAWRFGGPLPVGGIGLIDDLITAYETTSGSTVDLSALHWWQVFGSLKWGIICIAQAARHLTGVTRSHELAAIGRRVCENEWDLLELLE